MKLNANWFWRYLKEWHGWTIKTGFRKQDGTETGYRYCTPNYGEDHQVEGADWFKTPEEAQAFVGQFVEKDCQPFPSILNNMMSSPVGAGAAVAAEEMEVAKEGEEEGSSRELTGFETEEEMVRKLLRYHGFTKEGHKIIPPGGSVRGQRGEDYLEGEEDIRCYVLEKLQGLPPTQAPSAMAASSSSSRAAAAAAAAASSSSSSAAPSETGGGGKGKGKGKGRASAGKAGELQPTDLLDQTSLIEKLTKHHGWKKEWADRKGLVEEYIYVPPGGKKVGGVAGVDYALTFDQMRRMVVQKYFNGQEVLLQDYAVPVVEEIDANLTKERHFSLGGGAGGGKEDGEEEEDDDESEQSEDDEASDMEQSDGEEEEAEKKNPAAATVPPSTTKKTTRAKPSDKDAASSSSSSSSSSSQPQMGGPGGAVSVPRAPDEWFQRKHLVEKLQSSNECTAALEVLTKTHGWQVLPARSNYLSYTEKFYVAPGGNAPWDGGVHGVDYVVDFDELQNYISQGFGLLPNQFAPLSDVVRPDHTDKRMLSPLNDKTCRSTRSGRAYTNTGTKAAFDTSGLDESPPPLNLDEEGDGEDGGVDRFFHHSQDEQEEQEEGGPSNGRPRRNSDKQPARNSSNFFSDEEVEESFGGATSAKAAIKAVRKSVDSVAGRRASASFHTPGLARTTGKRKRSRKPDDLASCLTPAEIDRYTVSVLKAKNWTLAAVAATAASSSSAAVVGYELSTQDDPNSKRAFATERDALQWARGEGGLVEAEELMEHAERCPYQPLITAMEAARTKLGQAGSGECYVELVRQAEGQRLVDFYNTHILRPKGAWVRVSGLPGTGKTLAVQHSEALLRETLTAKGVEAAPTFVRLNCAAYTTPRSLLEALVGQLQLGGTTRRQSVEYETEEGLWSKLEERLRSRRVATGSSSSSSSSLSSSGSGSFSDVLRSPMLHSLTNFFRRSGGAAEAEEEELPLDKAREQVGKMVVLVLDELDQFIATNKETSACVLRLINSLVMEAGSRVLLVTVSNTIDDKTALGALWAKARGEKGAQAEGHEPIIFKPFTDTQLIQILKACVGETFHDAALSMIAKRVTASRGDARVAVENCRRALEKHLHTLQGKARGWCLTDDPQPEPTPADKQVTVQEANAVSQEKNPDGGGIDTLPQHAKLLLVVLLHSLEGGRQGKIKHADLQTEYTQQAKAVLGANQLGASGNFESNLEWLHENGQVEIQKGRGKQQVQIGPTVDWATVLPKLSATDKTLFKTLLPK